MKAESSKVAMRRLSPETLELIRQRGIAQAAGNRELTTELAKQCRQAIKEDLKERRAAVILEVWENYSQSPPKLRQLQDQKLHSGAQMEQLQRP
ncbi:unnamed protein product [Angiostrongylus costaricensis]|uniref:CID domain-containing protein n=1 Tax=Angiostrongylus costaricensis TaxID=334426 RepID=A0A0R3PWD6_ANGCS|nr:unnamed protein product [Angiostrongylus costaricensis]